MLPSTETTPLLLGNQKMSTADDSEEEEFGRYQVDRPVFSLQTYKDDNGAEFKLTPTQNKLCSSPNWGECCSLQSFISMVTGTFPILVWLRRYRIRKDLFGDIVSGITVATMNIPQGMAYAFLAQLPPIYGLYTSFFPVLFYMIMGTSRHISLATMSVISIMVGNVVAGYQDSYTDGTLTDIGVAAAVSFFAGCVQLLLGIVRGGFVVVYMSEQMVTGFITGVAFQVSLSQVKDLFGIAIEAQSGALNFFYTIAELIENIEQFNLATAILSVISSLLLIFVKEFLNPKVKAKFHVPIPGELLLLILATAVSHFAEFNERFDMAVVGNIPTGLPSPKIPDFEIIGEHIADGIAIGIIAFVISFTMAEVFAQKHGYEVNGNQEFIAMGVMNIASSFLQCFAASVAMSRSLVQEGAGGKTQLASGVSCVIILLLLLFIGPLFQELPKAVLAVVVILNLKGMFKQLGQLKPLWTVDKLDFTVWLISFSAVVFLDIILGLVVGVAISVISVIWRLQITSLKTHVVLDGATDIYCNEGTPLPGEVSVFAFQAPITFCNGKFLANKLKEISENTKKHFVLDISCCGYMDTAGSNQLKLAMKHCQKEFGVKVLLAVNHSRMLNCLEKHGLLDKEGKRRVFFSVHDAVMSISPKRDDAQYQACQLEPYISGTDV